MDNSGLGLWDTSEPSSEPNPPQRTTFKVNLGKTHILHRNYELLFHGDPSGGIVVLAIKIYVGWDLLVVRVRDLIALSNKPSYVLWEKYAKRLGGIDGFCVLHSRVVTWNTRAWCSAFEPDGDHICDHTVYDFVRHFPVEVEVGETFDRDPLAPVDSFPKQYTIKFQSANSGISYSLQVTEDGICIYVS